MTWVFVEIFLFYEKLCQMQPENQFNFCQIWIIIYLEGNPVNNVLQAWLHNYGLHEKEIIFVLKSEDTPN